MRRAIALTLLWSAAIGVVTPAVLSGAGPTTRTVYVTVVDDAGRAVPGLAPKDFVVKEGGKEREVLAVAPATERMRLALMVEHPLVGQSYVRFALAEFVARMCASADIALYMVTQRAEKLVDYTSNPSLLIDDIVNLPLSKPMIAAEVPDAVYEVAKQFEKTKPARPVIVLATTEQGQSTEVDPEGILSVLAKSKAQLWTVSIEPSGSQPSKAGIRSLQGFSGRSQIIGDGPWQSGGRRIPVLTLPAFEPGFKDVADDLSSQYLITYVLPDGVKASDRVSISLNKPGVTLRAPSRIPK